MSIFRTATAAIISAASMFLAATEIAEAADTTPAKDKLAAIAADYDRRINAATAQCKSDMSGCETKCATKALVSVIGKSGDTNSHLNCTNACRDKNDRCMKKTHTLQQKKERAISNAMNESSQSRSGSNAGSVSSAGNGVPPNRNTARPIDTTGSNAGSRTLPPPNDPSLKGMWAGQACAGACGRYVADAKCKAAGDSSMSCLTQNGYLLDDSPQLCAQAKALTGCMDKAETLGDKELKETGALVATSFDSVCDRNREKINQIFITSGLRHNPATYDLFQIEIQRHLADLYRPCMATSSKAREMYETGMRNYNEGKQHCAGAHAQHECLQWGVNGGVVKSGDPAHRYDNPASYALWKREVDKALADPNYSADLGPVRNRDTKRSPADIACGKIIDSAKSQFDTADRSIPQGSVVIRSEAVMWLMTQTMDAIRTKCPQSQEYRGLLGRYQTQYADVARVCEAMASAPPCQPRLPGKEPIKVQIAASTPPQKNNDSKQESCGTPTTANGVDCLAKKCAAQGGKWTGPSRKDGCYWCIIPGGNYSACPDGKNVAQ